MTVPSMHPADIVVFVLVLVVSMAIGVYHFVRGGKQKTTSEYLMADRNLGVLPTFLSILMSNMSAIVILGFTSDIYTRGLAFCWYLVGICIGTLLAQGYIVPLIYPLGLTSVNEYLERRFHSRVIRLVGAAFGLLQQALYMGVAIFAPSTALEAVTGIPVWASIIVMAAVGTIYTTMGGMKAVIWTDVFQAVIMYAGLMMVVVKGAIDVGGLSKVWEIALEYGRVNPWKMSTDPTEEYTLWSLLTFGTFYWTLFFGFVQASVQRYSAVRSVKHARICMLLNIPGSIILILLLTLIGLIVFAHYVTIRCDPLVNGDISNQNQILAYYVMSLLASWRGVSGLFLASLYSGALSTLSSGLNGLAAMTYEDLLKDRLAHVPEEKKALLNKCIVALYGVVSAVIAFMASLFQGSIFQITFVFLGSAGGCLLGIFVLAALIKKADWKFSLVGLVVGLGFVSWLLLGSRTVPRAQNRLLPPAPIDGCPGFNVTSANSSLASYTTHLHTNTSIVLNGLETNGKTEVDSELYGVEYFYSISYEWYSPIGFTIVFVVGGLLSLIFGKDIVSGRPKDEAPVVISAPKLFFCCPNSRCWSKCENDEEQVEDDEEREPIKDSTMTPV